MSDTVTILSHSRLRLAKLWNADGTISGYDDAKNYTVTEVEVASIAALSATLAVLESDPGSAVIRGKFKGDAAAATLDPGEHKPGLARKIKALYDDRPLHWVLIEVDKFTPAADPVLDPEAAITQYITEMLPAAFHDISYHWQLSSSAGHPSSRGVLKVHLWFWLATPATSDDLKRWAEVGCVDLDKSVFNSVQLHYTAAPVAAPGVVIPVPRRSGLHHGLFGDEVALDMARAAPAPVTGTDLAVWDDDLTGLSPTMGWTLAHGREVLFSLNADADRATWVNDLAAFHHEFSGSQDALDLAVEWSETAANFGSRKDVEDRWESFGRYRGGTPMTGRWLLKRRGECQAHQKYEARDAWAKTLTAASDEFTVREKLCPQIAKDDRLDDMGREMLAQALFESFKRLGTKYPIAECRKLVVEKRQPKASGESDLPDWLAGWVYVTNEDQFYRVDSEEWLTIQGFNARFNRELPTDEDGAFAKSAAWMALDCLGVPHVTKRLYLPWAGPIFTSEGVKCVNTYRPSTTPVAVERLGTDGHRAVQVVLDHFTVLAGGRAEVVDTLINWMAHNVQNPGVKVRWAPLWKGVEGDGKTVMGSLLAAVMGRVNVRNVSPKVLGTDFTGWAEGAALVVLEEIKLTGHNRYDILNALKPFLTNDSIEVHSKGKDAHDAINTTNYIAFTNYADALPLTETDRRWWIVFTPFASSAEMAAAVAHLAPSLGDYFDRLHDVIQMYPAELRRWLLDHQISASFKPNGSAPMTAEKRVMIGMSSTDEEDALREILAACEPSNVVGEEREGIRGVTKNLFASRCMGDALMLSDNDISLQTWTRNKLFSKVGFTKLPKKVKWDGEAHVIWIKGAMGAEPDAVRQILNKTIYKKVQIAENDVFDEKGSVLDEFF